MVKLIEGDCLIEMDKLISEGIKVDAIICDPPYQITASKWDISIPFEEMWKRLKKIVKPNGAIIIFGSEPFSSALRMSNIKQYKYDLFWVKNTKSNFLNAKIQPLRCVETVSIFGEESELENCENISIFYGKQCTYIPQKTEGHDPVNSYTKKSDGETLGKTKENYSGGGQTDRHPSNIIYFNAVTNDGSKEKRVHSAQKPIKLMEYLVKTYTKEKDVVLDFACGSGTTGLACKNLNRSFIGIELEKKYLEIARQRIK